MNQEAIENLIISSSRIEFNEIVKLILIEDFNCSPINVDAKGDGGSDFIILNDSASNRVAIQVTIQSANWESKAFNDAKKAQEKLSAKRYFFFTSMRHESKSMRSLEDRISANLTLPAKCLSAKEIAGIIIEHKLWDDLHRIRGFPIQAPQREIDHREMLIFFHE